MIQISLYLMSIFYILAGLNHFRDPQFYLKMMPKYLPGHLWLNRISGLVEILLGLCLLSISLKEFALYGIIALLIAVFPANVEMVTSDNFKKIPMKWKIARLPIQLLFIYWAYWHLQNAVV